MPLARGILRVETLQDLGAIMNGIRLLDEEVVCTGDNWAVGVGPRNGRRRCQTVEGRKIRRKAEDCPNTQNGLYGSRAGASPRINQEQGSGERVGYPEGAIR